MGQHSHQTYADRRRGLARWGGFVSVCLVYATLFVAPSEAQPFRDLPDPGIWQLGYGFQLSGLYFFGSGQRFSTNWGGDVRIASIGSARLRPNGTIVPRNNLVGSPIHRVDLRAQKRFGLGGSRSIDGIVEVFNLANHRNFGSYTTQESNRNYGQPSQDTNVAYQPRALQFGFRLAF